MKRFIPIAALFCVITALQSRAADPVTRPNIVIILADDLGYGDLHCYNPQRGKIATPRLDRLAAEGMRFMDAHSSSGVCSPSRYTLLTGRYHWRTRLQFGIVGVFGDALIARDRVTVASLARDQGYRTACIGKWHLGWEWPIDKEQRRLFQVPKGAGEDKTVVTEAHLGAWREVFGKPIPGGPTARGFDEYFGTDVPNWPPYCFIENDRTVGVPSEFLPAASLKNNLASLPGPALKDWSFEPILPTLGQRSADFITRQAKASQPFLLYLPLTSPHEPVAINKEWKGRSGLMPYADFVMETDDVVGRVLDALEKSGVADKTLVLFTSDNGKATYTGAAALEQQGHFSSGPLRGYKTSVYEGGHRVPFIVRWPGNVKPGAVCDQLVHQADVFATVGQILGAKPGDAAGEDSVSLLPLLKGEDKPVRQNAVSCASDGTPGFRHGPWKLILSRDEKAGTDVQLYHLGDDIAETRNLAAEKPERVAEMKAAYEKIITDGRSTPGPVQKNDVQVRRFPLPRQAAKNAK